MNNGPQQFSKNLAILFAQRATNSGQRCNFKLFNSSSTCATTNNSVMVVVVAQVVAHRNTDGEVPSLIPTGRWAFF